MLNEKSVLDRADKIYEALQEVIKINTKKLKMTKAITAVINTIMLVFMMIDAHFLFTQNELKTQMIYLLLTTALGFLIFICQNSLMSSILSYDRCNNSNLDLLHHIFQIKQNLITREEFTEEFLENIKNQLDVLEKFVDAIQKDV